jgi:hypothetical protein
MRLIDEKTEGQKSRATVPLMKNFWLRAMLHSSEPIFRQFVSEYLREFETEFKNIL